MPQNPVSIAEQTASPQFNAAAAETVAAIIGCATSGDANTPTIVRGDGQPAETFGAGPLVEVGRIVVGEGQQPAILVRATTATPGAYGTVDDSDFTGTAEVDVDATTVPNNAWEAYVIFETGGTVGTTGITYRTSLDNGRTVSALRALGTATSITILNSNGDGNVEFTLNPPEAALVALVADVRVQALAHFAEGAGIHNAADVTSGVGIGAAPTDLATSIARINQIRAALLLHAADTPTVHNSADATSFGSLPVAATDGPTAVTLANAIKAAYAVHAANATVHDAADATNVITAADATQGAVVAGDIIRVPTTAPAWDAAGLASAMASLNGFSNLAFGTIVIVGAVGSDATTWTNIRNALDVLETRQKPVTCLIEFRVRNAGETEAQYRTAFEAIYDSRSDNRIGVCVGDTQYDPSVVRQCVHYSTRTCLATLAARRVALSYEQSAALVKPIAKSASPSIFGGPLRGCRIVDDDGVLVGHDEAQDPGLSDLRAITTTRYPQEGDSAFIDLPNLLAPENDTVYFDPIRRIANVYKRLAYFWLTREVQAYALADVGSTTISNAAATAIEVFMRGKLRDELAGRVTSFTFSIDRSSVVVGPGRRVRWSGRINTGGWINGFDGTLQINGEV